MNNHSKRSITEHSSGQGREVLVVSTLARYTRESMTPATQDTRAVLCAEAVTKVYRMGEVDVHALRGVDFALHEGEFVVLLGASGSGKSSLFALLLGQLGADRGDIQGMSNLRLSHMAQEVHTTELPAAEYVWRGDEHLAGLMDRLTALEARGDYEAAAPLHSELEALDG